MATRRSGRKRKQFFTDNGDEDDGDDFDPRPPSMQSKPLSKRQKALAEAQSPVRKSSRTRKVRKVVMDDVTSDDDGEKEDDEANNGVEEKPLDEEESTRPVEATAQVMVKEEGDPEVIKNLKDVAAPIDSNAEMISIKVDPEAMTRRGEDDNEDDASDDPLEGEKGQPDPSPEQTPSSKQQPRPINSYILKECAEYTVDEVKLLLRIAEKFHTPRVYLMCPICGSVETVKNLGNHLYQTHSASAIRCPGKRCLGFRVNHNELADHIQAKHFMIPCTRCNEKVDARKIRHHQSVLCAKAPGKRIAPAPSPNVRIAPAPPPPPPNAIPTTASLLNAQSSPVARPAVATAVPTPIIQSPAGPNILPGIRTAVINPQPGAGPNTPVVISHTYTGVPASTAAQPAPQRQPLVLQPRQAEGRPELLELPAQVRSDQTRPNVIILPKQPPLRIRPGVVPFAVPPEVAATALMHASKDYEVMLGGKLVTIDGVFYYVKSDEVVFTDCPICEDRSMACSILGSHLITDHMQTSIQCYASGCDTVVQSNVLQEHLIGKHGKIQCRGCGFILGIVTAKEHFDEEGNCTKTRPQFAVGPVVASSPNSGGRLNSYDVSTGRPLLDKNANGGGDGAKGAAGGGSGLPAFDEFGQGRTHLSVLQEEERAKEKQQCSTVACPFCQRQCSNVKKHIRDVHQPKVSCPVCARRMGHSYLPEHMKIQHEGKEVPTKRCPLPGCNVSVQRLKNHLKASHKMSKKDADDLHERHYPSADAPKPGRPSKQLESSKHNPPTQLTAEGLPMPETSITIEDRILVFDD